MVHMTTANPNGSQAFKDFPEYDAAIYIWTYVSPFLLLTGTTGSILSVMVLMRSKLQSPTMTFYLIQLACNDVIVLNIGLLHYWVKNTFGFNLRQVSGAACKIHTFLVTLFLDYSAWIVVLLTVDRCICVCKPTRALRMCNMRNAKIASFSVFFMLACVNMQFLWTHDLVHRGLFGTKMDCYVPKRYEYFWDYVWMWMDFCVFSLIPFIIMITCNALIIRVLHMSSRKLDAHRKQSSLSTARILNSIGLQHLEECPAPKPSSPTITEVYYKEINESDQSLHAKPNENLIETNTERKVDDDKKDTKAGTSLLEGNLLVSGEATSLETGSVAKDNTRTRKVIRSIRSSSSGIFSKTSKIGQKWKPSKLAIMLFSINCVFLLLTSPIVIYQIGLTEWKRNATPHGEAQLILAWAVVSILQYTDNAIHFFQYYMTVPTFRRVFRVLIINCGERISFNSSTSNVNTT